MSEKRIAKIAVAAANYSIDKPYDYLVPPELEGRLELGMRVLVPFGRGNRLTEAMILSLHQAVPDKPLKAVRSLLDEEPVITGLIAHEGDALTGKSPELPAPFQYIRLERRFHRVLGKAGCEYEIGSLHGRVTVVNGKQHKG